MFIYRLYRVGKEVLLAVCDERIRGKKLRDKPLFVVSDFYGEERASKEIIDIVGEATSINAVGNEIVDLLIKEGVVDRRGVVEIGGEKHAIVVKI